MTGQTSFWPPTRRGKSEPEQEIRQGQRGRQVYTCRIKNIWGDKKWPMDGQQRQVDTVRPDGGWVRQHEQQDRSPSATKLGNCNCQMLNLSINPPCPSGVIGWNSFQFPGGRRCLLHFTAAHFNINTGITNQQPFISLFFPSPLLSLCFILLETMGSHNDKRASTLWCSAPFQLPVYWFCAQQCTDSQREEVLGEGCGGRSDGAKRHFNSKVFLFHSNLI